MNHTKNYFFGFLVSFAIYLSGFGLFNMPDFSLIPLETRFHILEITHHGFCKWTFVIKNFREFTEALYIFCCEEALQEIVCDNQF